MAPKSTKSQKPKITRPKTKKKSQPRAALFLFTLFIALLIAAIPIAYYYGFESADEDAKKELKSEIKKETKSLSAKNDELIKKLSETLKKNDVNESTQSTPAQKLPSAPVAPQKINEPPVLKEVSINGEIAFEPVDNHDYLSEAKDYEKSEKSAKKQKIETQKKRLELKGGEKPKLVIIIDDVSTNEHLQKIKSLGIKVTPSLFPPSPFAPNMDKYALDLKSYMVHLPLEAHDFKNREKELLTTHSTQEQIEKRVMLVRGFFPDAKYVNNHTGSKFTADERSMELLLAALKKYDFKFLDSRTTPDSVAQIAGEKAGQSIFSRDVFLDNKPDVEYIKGQLKLAIKKAKENGYAIAIGHPHHATFKAIAGANGDLSDVDVVYIDELKI